ncbi:hypothetical protein PINS_up012645 [Pythium insidiosum]|nr:hypothetical protein PINS_up012645 [Pythium insidiosum]
MKAPDAALVRGRAKVAPADATVLHLESAGIQCLRGLEVCARLRSLYASENPLRSIVEVSSLASLWRLDLSHTTIRDLAPLAAFAALGFLSLENGSLAFSDLCCLREVHVLELRVAGNPALLPSSSGDDSVRVYRERVVALLPNAWVLDGHFVSTRERALAIERQDAFVMELLLGSSSSSSAGAASTHAKAFGSTSALWAPHLLRVRSDSSLHTSNNDSTAHAPSLDAMTLLRSLDAEPTRRPELQDLHRLRVLLSLHDRECDVHNASSHLAPSRHSPNARPLPRARVNDLLSLPRRGRLAVAVLLAARLEFQLYARVVADALTLVLLSSEPPIDSASLAAAPLSPDELALLPPYALTGLLACLRDHALQEEDTLRHRAQFSTHNAWDEFDARLWRSMPAVFTSLLALDKDQRLSALARTARASSATQSCLYVSDAEAESFSLRCAYAVSLLARAASCPDNSTAPSLSPSRLRAHDAVAESRRSASATAVAGDTSLGSSLELAELRHAARAAPSEALEAVGLTPPLAFAAMDSNATSRSAVAALPWRRKPVERDYRRPWNEGPSTSADDHRVATAERVRGAGQRPPASETNTRRPRAGEWIEVHPKTFLRVRCVSEDRRYVSVSPHAEANGNSSSSDVVSIRTDRLVRVSGSMWRLTTSHDAVQTNDADDEALAHLLQRLRGGREAAAKLGRLHRESEAFHRHGAARTQGFPNRDVTSADLRSLGPTEPLPVPVPRPVELFAAHDTLDANYVLTSPSLVAIQNACATRAFQSQRRPPAGLWGPIEVPSFQVASVNSLPPSSDSKKALGLRESEPGSLVGRTTLAVEQPEAEEDDWQTLQRDLAALLRRQDDSTRRRKIAQKMEDVPCFLTRLPGEQDDGSEDSAAATAGLPTTSEATATLDKSASTPTLPTAAQTTRSHNNHKQRAGVGPLAPLWHHVPTKPQLLVAAVTAPSPSPPTRLTDNGASTRGVGDEERAGAGQRAHSSTHKPSLMPRAATLTLSLPSLPASPSPAAPLRS